MGNFIAAYLAHAARVAFAAGAMLIVGVALWVVIGVLTSLAGVQTGALVLTSTALIVVVAIAAGAYVSVRYITPDAVLHPVIAAVAMALLVVALTTRGDVGALRLLVPLGAGAIAAFSAVISRSSKAPPNNRFERSRDA